MSEQALINVIGERLNGLGQIVVGAAKNSGIELSLNESGKLDIADVAALIDHESWGGKNIFGADHGVNLPDAPPYSHHPVTRERVQKLINQPGYREGKAKMNGIGPPQITYYTLVLDAEHRGGAHLPEHQIPVAVEYLRYLVRKLGYRLGIAAYNVGEGRPQDGVDNGYFAKVMEKREKWKQLLGEVEVVPEYAWEKYGWEECSQGANVITPRSRTDKNGAGTWQKDGYYVRGSDGSAIFKAPPSRPPKAGKRHPGSGPYVDAHPTHFNFREDVRGLVDKYEDEFYGQIYLNTYVGHPPGWEQYEHVSFDVWDDDGRGRALDFVLGDEVWSRIFNDPEDPRIQWIIYKGWMWTRSGGWQVFDPPEDGSDPGHWRHIHVSYKL